MFNLVIIGILWGVTNPLIRKGAAGVEKIKKSSVIGQYMSELLYLFTRWQYVLPFALNQVGSVAYYFCLQSSDLSLAVALVNSLTFLFTTITGVVMGENIPDSRTIMGMVLLLSGISCYIVDKMDPSQ